MKILFIGAATSNHTIRWVNTLSDRGHDVLLLSRGDQRDNKNRVSPKVKIHYLKFGGGIGYYFNAFETKKILKTFMPDVVNAHYASGYGTLARVAKCRPLVLSVWGSDVYDFPWKNKRNRKLVCKNLRFADEIASTSFAMASETRKVLDDENQEIAITPFGVDLEIFKPSADKNKNGNVIGIVKFLEPIYDIPLLINSFEIVKRRKQDAQLHIYGDGRLKDELVEMCKEKGIYDSVHFFGIVPNNEVPRALNSLDVFVNCSKRESFGVAIVEAMACHVPVVATDCEGFKEIIDDPKYGIIIDRRDPTLMAEKLIYLLENPDAANTIADNALEKVNKLYNWDNNVSAMEDLYLKAISKHKGK